jgi:hypothetical protein
MMAALKTESGTTSAASMVTIERSIDVTATAEAVTALMNDTQKFSHLFAGVEKVEPDEMYPQMGGTLKLLYKVAGLSLEIEQRVIEERAGFRKAESEMRILQFSHLRPLKGFNTFQWEAAAGSIRLTFIYQYDPPHFKTGKEMEKWMIRRYTAAGLEKSLKNIKGALENG